ncbi:MAG: hypothetical protein AAFU57_15805 [Bacteroidota bacterium]
MKTQISKQNAIIILENVMKQQTLIHRLQKVTDGAFDEYCGGTKPIEVLFNVDFSKMSGAEYALYFEFFLKTVEDESLSFRGKAERLYSEYSRINEIRKVYN